MKYETVIGIEIHCELKTKTKMFSSAPVAFGEVANTCVNEVDLGHPGTLPCVNKEAVRLAVKAATALRCEIDPLVKLKQKMARKIFVSIEFTWKKIQQNSSIVMQGL